MEENSKVVLKIEGISNIKYEEPEEFKTSVSYQYYKQALKMTEEILNNNFLISQNEESGQYSGTDLRNSRQLYNIIFFTGDRGAGKTSTMLSYMEFLKDYFRNTKKETFKGTELEMHSKNREVMFTGLEYIDASVLDDKEDILGSVLSKMLKKWIDEENKSQGGIVRNSDYDHKKRKLQKLFSNVYECRKKIRDVNIYDDNSEMFMDNLQNMSLTFNMQREFRKLVFAYLDIMKYPGAEYLNPQSHFLVVCIDDLDMNIRKGFELLEQVRKYLMIPNIIVLLSANYEQLDKICNNHYFKEFEKTKNNDMSIYVENLSREYLEKIIPMQRQIIMTSGEKWLLKKQKNLEIQYTDIDANKFEKSGGLREIVQESLKERMNIFWDREKMTLDYLTPTTLRELCAWITEISSFKINDKNNAERFLEEEFFRICRKYLSSDEQRYFMDAEKVSVESRICILYNALYKYVKDLGVVKVKNPKVGDVLELIAYTQGLELKAVILGTLTSIYLTLKIKIILQRIEEDIGQEQKEEQIKLLNRYFDNGIWGEWENENVGFITIIDDQGTELREIENIARYKSDNMNNSLQLKLTGSCNPNDKKSVSDFLKANSEQLINYQYMLLFYDLDVEKDSVIWEKANGTENDKSIILTLPSQYKGSFSFSNALLNLQFQEGIAFRFIPEFIRLMKFEKAEIKKEVKQYNILKNNINKNESQLLPFENMECLIDIAQTIRENLGHESIVTESGIDEIVRKYFQLIMKSLKKYARSNELYIEDTLIKKLNEEEFCKMLRNSILSSVPRIESGEDDDWMGGLF